MRTIGQAIERAYKRAGITQDELGRRIGRTQGTISEWKMGRGTPSFDDVRAIDKACELPVGFVLHAAGYVANVRTVPEAIAMDPALSSEARDFLLALYERAAGNSVD